MVFYIVWTRIVFLMKLIAGSIKDLLKVINYILIEN